jgi:hypothetical protein
VRHKASTFFLFMEKKIIQTGIAIYLLCGLYAVSVWIPMDRANCEASDLQITKLLEERRNASKDGSYESYIYNTYDLTCHSNYVNGKVNIGWYIFVLIFSPTTVLDTTTKITIKILDTYI